MQRCHYVITACLNLLDFNTFDMQAVYWGWSFVKGMLMADKSFYSIPADFLIKCGCEASCIRNCGYQRREWICTECCKCQITKYLLKTWIWQNLQISLLISRYQESINFYSPWNHQKTVGFLDNLTEMNGS